MSLRRTQKSSRQSATCPSRAASLAVASAMRLARSYNPAETARSSGAEVVKATSLDGALRCNATARGSAVRVCASARTSRRVGR